MFALVLLIVALVLFVIAAIGVSIVTSSKGRVWPQAPGMMGRAGGCLVNADPIGRHQAS